MNCDFCNIVIYEGTFTTIDANTLRAIVKNGFNFSDLKLPLDNPVYAMLNTNGISIEDYDNHWKGKLVTDNTDWAACHDCFEKIHTFDEKKDTDSVYYFILTSSNAESENKFLQTNIADYGHPLLNVFLIKDIKRIEFSESYVQGVIEPSLSLANVNINDLHVECHYTLDSDFNDLLIVRAFEAKKIAQKKLPQKLKWSNIEKVRDLEGKPENHIIITAETISEAEEKLTQDILKGFDIETKMVLQEPLKKTEKVFAETIENAISKLPDSEKACIKKKDYVGVKKQTEKINAKTEQELRSIIIDNYPDTVIKSIEIVEEGKKVLGGLIKKNSEFSVSLESMPYALLEISIPAIVAAKIIKADFLWIIKVMDENLSMHFTGITDGGWYPYAIEGNIHEGATGKFYNGFFLEAFSNKKMAEDYLKIRKDKIIGRASIQKLSKAELRRISTGFKSAFLSRGAPGYQIMLDYSTSKSDFEKIIEVHDL